MRIVHAPVEISGQLALSAYGLREVGAVAHSFSFLNPSWYAMRPDFSVRSPHPLWQRLECLGYACLFAADYDVFHFHYASSFLPKFFRYLDARLLRNLGRRVVVEFWGTDARLPSVEAERNPYYVNTYMEDDSKARTRLKQWAAVTAGHAVMADHSFDAYLKPYFPHIHVVGQRVDTRRLQPCFPRPETTVPLVVHAPSHPAYKGTKYVRRAVERLQAGRIPFEYVEVHGVAHAAALEIYARADLVIDQLCAGAHGVFAVEAFSLGKPVISYILPELVSTYPAGFPVINATPDTLEEVLAIWLRRPTDRYWLGVQSREYAERVHDCRVVARRLMDVYENLS
jgi:glycosyltransferase involved in cell wall biosynthesis